MARPKRQKFVAQAFAKRLQSAMEQNPNCPPKYQGERTWLAERLLQLGVNVGLETIRKWVEGETLPTPDKFEAIAAALQVDTHWLMFGETAEDTPHSFEASPLTNIVAGIIALDGGIVSFPADDGRVKGKAHLHAVVRGANYPLHIVAGAHVGDDLEFRVPPHHEDVIVIGVVRRDGYAFDMYELGADVIAEAGDYERGAIVVKGPESKFRQITTFAERL